MALEYLTYLPRGYDDRTDPSPLILFLHGAGETGRDLAKVERHGPHKAAVDLPEFPFIVIAPQTPRYGWNPLAVAEALSQAVADHRVDQDRVYLTGISMGGFGAWLTAAAFPDRFAAIVPICGGGDPRHASRLRHLPTWVFHGALDDIVPLENSMIMVDALKAAGAPVKFTVYPDAAHDAWTATYASPELYTWLLSHRRTSERR